MKTVKSASTRYKIKKIEINNIRTQQIHLYKHNNEIPIQIKHFNQ